MMRKTFTNDANLNLSTLLPIDRRVASEQISVGSSGTASAVRHNPALDIPISPEWNADIELNPKGFFRVQHRRSRKSKLRYRPQSGEMSRFSAAFAYLKDVRSDITYRKLLMHLERAGCLLILLSEVKTISGYSAALTQYISSYLNESMADYATIYVNELMSSFNTPQAGGDSDDNTWLSYLMTMKNNWKAFISAPIFSHISRVISVAVTLGLCSITKSTWTFGGIQLFSALCEKKHMNALDMIDALMATACFFMEAGYDAIRTKSLSPFFMKKEVLSPLDDMYFRVKGAMKVLASGNLELSDVKDENDLIHLIERGIQEYGALLAATKEQSARIVLEKRYGEFREWKLQFLAKTAGGGLREAPFSIFIKGSPGIGKSVMTSTFMTSLLKYNGFEAGTDRVATINLGDKYMSNYKSSINGVIADDIGQGSPKYETGNPARVLIDIINNTISYANKAEIENKGMVIIRPKVFIGNANTEYMGFSEYLTCPSAGMRRGIHLEVKLKDIVATDGKFDREKYAEFLTTVTDAMDRICPDIYEFSLFTYRMGDSISSIVKMPFVHEGVIIKNVTYQRCMEILLAESRTHFANQKRLVDELMRQPKVIQMCACGKLNYMCNCVDAELRVLPMEQHNAIIRSVSSLQMWWNIGTCYLYDKITAITTTLGIMHYCSSHMGDIIRTLYALLGIFILGMMPIIYYGGYGGLISFVTWLFICAKLYIYIFEKQMRAASNNRGYLPTLSYRPVLMGSALAASLFAVYKLYRAYQVLNAPSQGNLQPASMADIEERDKEINPWASVQCEELPCSEASSTTTPPNLEAMVAKNLVLCLRHDGDNDYVCNGFVIKSGLLLLPFHMVKEAVHKYTFRRFSKGILGSSFSQHIQLADCVCFPEKDLVLVPIPNGGSWSDLSHYLQYDSYSSFMATMSFLDLSGKRQITRGFRATKQCINNGIQQIGYAYELKINTFTGMCMGVIIAERAKPTICGFHIGGVAGSGKGCGALLTSREFIKAEKALSEKTETLVPHQAGTFRTTIFGSSNYMKDIEKNSPLNFMPKTPTSLVVYGGCIGAARYFSNVVQSCTSKAVTRIMNFPQQFSGPKFQLGKQVWRNHLLKVADPGIGPTVSAVSRASRDYMASISPCFEMYKGLLRPLTELETVNGIPGCRFIDRMNLKASVGFPNSGPKRKLVHAVDDVNVNFPPEVWEEVAKLEEKYANGERVYPIFKACLKDEAKSVDSMKVRVFQAAPLELQILIRKYFLPVVRVLSLFPIASECAVGINAVSKEWEQLDDYIMKYGKEAVIAGDYSGYDTRMSAVLTSAAFNILIKLAAKYGNYSERDITIMRGLATDVIYPCMAMNGDLIQLFGSTPSGHNLTVYINSICNSLLLRCGFFSVYPEMEGLFNTAVANTTYGDDLKGTVAEKFRKFNFLTYQAYLTTIGSTLTHPDKKSECTEFLGDVDFLKRRTVYIPEIDCKVGALDQDSILRSLKVCMPSKHVVAEQAAADNIDGALREWFFHGREVYESRRKEAQQVAAECDIIERCNGLDITFDQRVQIWQTKNKSMEILLMPEVDEEADSE